jgi:hypothetical protein
MLVDLEGRSPTHPYDIGYWARYRGISEEGTRRFFVVSDETLMGAGWQACDDELAEEQEP